MKSSTTRSLWVYLLSLPDTLFCHVLITCWFFTCVRPQLLHSEPHLSLCLSPEWTWSRSPAGRSPCGPRHTRWSNPGRCAAVWKVQVTVKGKLTRDCRCEHDALTQVVAYHRVWAVLLQRRREPDVPDRHMCYFVHHFSLRHCCGPVTPAQSRLSSRFPPGSDAPPTSACDWLTHLSPSWYLKRHVTHKNSAEL